MKLIATLAAFAAFTVSASALADTVNITSVTDLTDPNIPGAISSTNGIGFVGTRTITFTVAGKTCNWVGSASGSVPLGCNYGLTVNQSTGALSNPISSNNPVCTNSAEMLSLCK